MVNVRFGNVIENWSVYIFRVHIDLVRSRSNQPSHAAPKSEIGRYSISNSRGLSTHCHCTWKTWLHNIFEVLQMIMFIGQWLAPCKITTQLNVLRQRLAVHFRWIFHCACLKSIYTASIIYKILVCISFNTISTHALID